jgi:hypothetical protein
MPSKRKKRSKVRAGRRNFSPEFERFLAGDDSCFTDAAAWGILSSERYFADAADLESLTPAEQARYDMLLEEQRIRREAGEFAHYRRLAKQSDVLPQWQAYVDAGEDPAFAFTYAQQQACEASVPESPPQARPN